MLYLLFAQAAPTLADISAQAWPTRSDSTKDAHHIAQPDHHRVRARKNARTAPTLACNRQHEKLRAHCRDNLSQLGCLLSLASSSVSALEPHSDPTGSGP